MQQFSLIGTEKFCYQTIILCCMGVLHIWANYNVLNFVRIFTVTWRLYYWNIYKTQILTHNAKGLHHQGVWSVYSWHWNEVTNRVMIYSTDIYMKHNIPSIPWLSGTELAITDWILQHTNSVTSSSLSKEFRVSDRFLCSHSQSFSISVNVSEQAITKHEKDNNIFSHK
jgi:hypothetical protein